MLTLPDWASLKGRGGPWPGGLELQGQEFWLRTDDPWHKTSGMSPAQSTVAALFRDEAVWTLRQQDREHVFRATSEAKGAVAILVYLPSGQAIRAVGEDADHALFNAWTAVLDARDAAKAQVPA